MLQDRSVFKANDVSPVASSLLHVSTEPLTTMKKPFYYGRSRVFEQTCALKSLTM